MDTRLLPVFVYGTLLPGEANHVYIEDMVRESVPASISGVMYGHKKSWPLECLIFNNYGNTVLTVLKVRFTI
ncbi:MAG: hypothetical protein PWP31_49 [Clostridia bacterium]|nr:hypothetical protein [Clostridia bacterium]